jgi:hypothetical protein
VDRAGYEEIAGVLHGLVIGLSDRLTGQDRIVVTEFIEVGEVGLALEQIADVLSEYEQPVTADERSEMLALAARMTMGPRVARALSLCPDR